MLDRAVSIEQNFIDFLTHSELISDSHLKLPMDDKQLWSLYESQLSSRLLDLLAREYKEKGYVHYTIGSSGHEGNVVLGMLSSAKDMAFLHYRSGAFYIQRAKEQGLDGINDIIHSLFASEADQIASGRHKVFGNHALNIPPQTSTIASHLPKALGCAISITRAKELKLDMPLSKDSVVLCSFGDASVNHAVAQTTFNACRWLSSNSYPIPLILICEDNGLGISVKTPSDWIEQSFCDRQGLHYIQANGLDVIDTYVQTQRALKYAREKRQPVFLHMKCCRLMGHAGSDIESQYLSDNEIKQQEAKDPLLITARYVIERGIQTSEGLLTHYLDKREILNGQFQQAMGGQGLTDKDNIMKAIVPMSSNKDLPRLPTDSQRQQVFKEKYAQLSLKRTLQQCINLALTDLLLQYPNLLIFGEDVGKKGGVYRVTADLQSQFGQRRVFDTLLDETTILGSAIGYAHNGFIPMPEIQFLAYLHNAEDQIRGEAATLSFFSSQQFINPMVIRIPSFAYQKGFGGHFHNDNSFAVLRDVPGLIIMTPSNGSDAAKLLRKAVQLAYQENRVVVFLEPIALYMTKDLYQTRDNGWLSDYPPPKEQIELGDIEIYGEGETVIISYANGVYLSRQAQQYLMAEHQLSIRVIDLRWLKPLPMIQLIRALKTTKKILIVDECRKTGSLSEQLVTELVESDLPNDVMIKRHTGQDSFIPLGHAWSHVLPSKETIIEAILSMQAHKELR